jgi:hypothetical protein
VYHPSNGRGGGALRGAAAAAVYDRRQAVREVCARAERVQVASMMARSRKVCRRHLVLLCF